MATPRVAEFEIKTPPIETKATSVTHLTPILHESLEKNSIFSLVLLVILQVIFIILLTLHGNYGHEPLIGLQSTSHVSKVLSTTIFSNGTKVFVSYDVPISYRGLVDFYSIFQNIHVMIFIGFGFLFILLRRYGYSAVGYNFFFAIFLIQWALIVHGYMFDFDLHTKTFPIDVERMIRADFVAAAVLISFGTVIGKTNLTQLVLIAFIEILFQSSNEFLGRRRFCAYDIGQSMFIHTFGAFYGIAVGFMLYHKDLTNIEVEQREKSTYHSNIFSMIGTLFLFCFWPSFNAALAKSTDARLRTIVNTYLSIISSVLLTYISSYFLNKEKKFTSSHIQNATLAGGVAIGTVANKIIRPFGAIIIGSIAGLLSTLGFRWIKSDFSKYRLHGFSNVLNVHGIPGLLAGIFGIILAIFPSHSLYRENLLETCWHGYQRTYRAQIGYQAATLGVTIGIAIISGLITGAILRLPFFNDRRPSSYYNDRSHWDASDDFYQDVTTVIIPSHVEHHVLA